jgi:N-acetyl-anhydromuramyl-L-alanine amidase AmpD
MTTFSNNLWLPKALFDAGLKVSEVAGWQTRGRRLLTVRGVICHHTASAPGKNAPSLSTVIHGRSDLAGPLCQILLGRDGTCYIVAAGAANHAGRGLWMGLNDGNGQMLGIEAENSGVGEPWLEKQFDAYVRLCAAICRQRKLDAGMVAGHREYALPKGRKIDPTGIDMPGFRHMVAALLGGVAAAPELVEPFDQHRRLTLRRGASGDDVAALQRALGIEADAEYGPKTEAAVRAFQRSHDLVPDGLVGPRTWAAIDALTPDPKPAAKAA